MNRRENLPWLFVGSPCRVFFFLLCFSFFLFFFLPFSPSSFALSRSLSLSHSLLDLGRNAPWSPLDFSFSVFANCRPKWPFFSPSRFLYPLGSNGTVSRGHCTGHPRLKSADQNRACNSYESVRCSSENSMRRTKIFICLALVLSRAWHIGLDFLVHFGLKQVCVFVSGWAKERAEKV